MAPRFVLLHSPLLGPLAWRAVAAELTARGHVAETPAWTPLSEAAEPFYVTLADRMAARLGSPEEAPVLVAHSGAGALIPAVAARLPGVAGVIYADAILPHPGRSWFDTAPPELARQLRDGAQMGELPPWSDWWPPGALERLVPDAAQREPLLAELEPLPLSWFEERAPLDAWTGPTAYLQLSGAYDAESQVAARSGWPLLRHPLHHLAMLTHPQAVAAAIQSLAQRLSEPAHG
ncbi:MAG TPA: hypothetical protein VGC92_08740 [Phenylobacterium sp.]|jgi:hypothetical protein